MLGVFFNFFEDAEELQCFPSLGLPNLSEMLPEGVFSCLGTMMGARELQLSVVYTQTQDGFCHFPLPAIMQNLRH